jgi:hypothetical protein
VSIGYEKNREQVYQFLHPEVRCLRQAKPTQKIIGLFIMYAFFIVLPSPTRRFAEHHIEFFKLEAVFSGFPENGKIKILLIFGLSTNSFKRPK